MADVRALTDAAKLERFMERLGGEARGPGRVYLVGEATAALYGWRTSTVDADLKLDPEPAGVFESIRHVEDDLDMNVELAAPDIPTAAAMTWLADRVFGGPGHLAKLEEHRGPWWSAPADVDPRLIRRRPCQPVRSATT